MSVTNETYTHLRVIVGLEADQVPTGMPSLEGWVTKQWRDGWIYGIEVASQHWEAFNFPDYLPAIRVAKQRFQAAFGQEALVYFATETVMPIEIISNEVNNGATTPRNAAEVS